jgi:hypothetical protein
VQWHMNTSFTLLSISNVTTPQLYLPFIIA